MKKLLLFLLLLSPSLGLAQSGVSGGPTPGLAQPDCNLPFSFTAAGSSASFDNRTIGCSSWHLMYYADGCSVVSIQPQFAPDNSGVAGAFSVFPATSVFGTVPLSGTQQGQVTFSQFYPWVNVRLITGTNCTLVSGRMIGWKAQGSSEATAAANPSQGTAAEGTTAAGFPQQVGGKFETTPTVLSNGQQGVLQQDTNQNLLSVINPTTLAADAIPPVVNASVGSNVVLKSGAGNLYSAYVTTGTTAGFLMIFDATSAPGDGAVTPKQCVEANANATTAINFGSGPPESYATGITLVFSSTGCFTKTASATAFLHGSVK